MAANPPAPSAPPAISPSFPTYPPIELGIAEILVDPQKYVIKLVKTSGAAQAVDTAKEAFDLRQGDRVVPVSYRLVGLGTKSKIGRAASGQTMVVTGLLQLDESDNSYYILAQEVEVR